MTPEGKVKAKVNRALAQLPQVWRFMPVQMGMGIPALDYLLCIAGEFVAIETKVKGKTLTARQLKTLEEICAAGGRAFVVDDDASLAKAMKCIKLGGSSQVYPL